MTFSFNLNISLFFKLIFIVILILLTVYLVYQEFILVEKTDLNNIDTMEKSNSARNTLKDIIFKYIPSMIAYHSIIKKSDSQQIAEAATEFKQKEATLKKAVESAEDFSDIQRVKFKADIAEVRERFDTISRYTFKKDNLEKELSIINSIKMKSLTGKTLSQDEQRLLNSESNLIKDLKYYNNLHEDAQKKIINKFDEISKSNFFNVDFNFQDFIANANLTTIELLALGNILLNQLVLSYTISIIFILYGDYLINRFDLENKYPKIAKFIQLRRKLQGYYLKISFT